ncbi:hypothetical protein MYA_3820 [Burkholderia sp. KJ006]|nr:hypothetical protein MYA_3820 [Burkholderia sp. KJ006]
MPRRPACGPVLRVSPASTRCARDRLHRRQQPHRARGGCKSIDKCMVGPLTGTP